jgi:hypothetical protein
MGLFTSNVVSEKTEGNEHEMDPVTDIYETGLPGPKKGSSQNFLYWMPEV